MHHPTVAGDRHVFTSLNISYFTIFSGYTLWRFILPNYAVETFNVGSKEISTLFSLTAIPGVFAVCIGFVAGKVKPSLLMIASSLLVGSGLFLIGVYQAWQYLLGGVLAIGIGFAAYYPIVTSFCIESATVKNVSVALGRLKCYGPLAALASALFIQLTIGPLGYGGLLMVAGICVIVVGLLAAGYVKKMKYIGDQGSLRFRANLCPYYALNFLAGARSAFFKFFIVVLLVKVHGLKIQQTAWIGMIGSVLIGMSYLFLGKMASRHEPRNVLSATYALVALLFIGFAGSKDLKWVLVALFWGDSLLFGVSAVADSHLKQFSSPSNLVGDIAAGLTLFHIARILVPQLVRTIWDNYGDVSAFTFGIIVALLAVLVSRMLVPVKQDG